MLELNQMLVGGEGQTPDLLNSLDIIDSDSDSESDVVAWTSTTFAIRQATLPIATRPRIP